MQSAVPHPSSHMYVQRTYLGGCLAGIELSLKNNPSPLKYLALFSVCTHLVGLAYSCNSKKKEMNISLLKV